MTETGMVLNQGDGPVDVLLKEDTQNETVRPTGWWGVPRQTGGGGTDSRSRTVSNPERR